MLDSRGLILPYVLSLTAGRSGKLRQTSPKLLQTTNYKLLLLEHSYWARDLFVVFLDGDALAADAWLTDYHGLPERRSGNERGQFKRDADVPRGGYMLGAVVLEVRFLSVSEKIFLSGCLEKLLFIVVTLTHIHILLLNRNYGKLRNAGTRLLTACVI